MIPRGATLGLLGGGQLGRMFTMAAQSMGYKVVVLDPSTYCPAGSVADRHICAEYLDASALDRLATACAAVTTEFENVPAEALDYLASHCIVSPSAQSVAIAQDRIKEKSFLSDCGISIAPYAVIQNTNDLEREAIRNLFPGILKLARLGYDGKGQARVRSRLEALAAFKAMGENPCVLEQALSLKMEVSMVFARTADGDIVTYPSTENQHANGILDISIAPARISNRLAEKVHAATLTIAKRLDYYGVACVEYFVLGDDGLVANEIAPRPHNSGHYTIDANVTSQFEQQVRTLAGLPLGSTKQHCAAVTVNLLGDLWGGSEPDWQNVLAHACTKLHLYGKSEPRPGRKMGHYTCLDESLEKALEAALQIREQLVSKIPTPSDM